MNRTEFKETTETTDFCKRCLENEYHGRDVYRELLEKGKNIAAFKKLVLKDERVKLKQETAELLKNDESYWYYLRSMLCSI
ncbi:hypothetical protein IZY60_13270 [Lutibacter sp. B2]|nr:hypothetical protein [Lutibacter sp. B2]